MRLKLRRMSFHRTEVRCSAGCDSSIRKLPANRIVPNKKRLQKMPCHPLASAKKPPAIGAATVATPFMPPMTANTPASSRAEYLSAAMERERTTPPAPDTPCKKRKVMNCRMFSEKMQPAVDNRKSMSATDNTGRRPYLSLNGPKNSWPAASPAIQVVSPSCTIDDVVRK